MLDNHSRGSWTRCLKGSHRSFSTWMTCWWLAGTTWSIRRIFAMCFSAWRGAWACPQQGEVHLQCLTGGLPGPCGGCHWLAAAPGTCVSHLRLPTAVYKRRAAEVPGYGELIPPFHLQSCLHPQAADRHHTWTWQTQHAGRVDPAAEFCFQTSQDGVVRRGSLGTPTSAWQWMPATITWMWYFSSVQGTVGSLWLSSAES